MKKILFVCALTLASAGASAQNLSGTTINDRLTNNPDSAEVLQSISLYRDAFKTNDFKEAIEPWEFVFT